MPLVSLVTDYGDVTVNPPTVHGARKSIAPLPINPAWIGRFDPVRSIFLHPCFLPRPIGPYPGNRCIKTSRFGVKQYTHLAFKARFLFTFAYRIFTGFISSARTDFSSVFSVSFGTHWFTHRRQTSANTRSFFIPSLARLPMLYSDSLFLFC